MLALALLLAPALTLALTVALTRDAWWGGSMHGWGGGRGVEGRPGEGACIVRESMHCHSLAP